jgi:hypothetical protein
VDRWIANCELGNEKFYVHRGVDRWTRRGNDIGTPQADIPGDTFPLNGIASWFVPRENHRQFQRKAEMLPAFSPVMRFFWNYRASLLGSLLRKAQYSDNL